MGISALSERSSSGGIAIAYFTRIGLHRENRAGMGSRGYWIFRRGRNVYMRFGAVDVDGARGGRFRWRWIQERKRTFRSVGEAQRFMADKVRDQVRDGYQELPTGRRIEPARRR